MLHIVTAYGLELRAANKHADTPAKQIGAYVGPDWRLWFGPITWKEEMGIALFGAFWRA